MCQNLLPLAQAFKNGQFVNLSMDTLVISISEVINKNFFLLRINHFLDVLDVHVGHLLGLSLI